MEVTEKAGRTMEKLTGEQDSKVTLCFTRVEADLIRQFVELAFKNGNIRDPQAAQIALGIQYNLSQELGTEA